MQVVAPMIGVLIVGMWMLIVLIKLMMIALVKVAVVDRELLCGGSGREIDL